eukprot:gb/GECG01011674.1/.p1 GENE.gb/GECG01011674.1/~~gb/GECG01011674.1/.p1  ORF type:complete len:144 (+),score=9.80 gb/GECG01011674.1/:1-432(+)
MILITPSDDDTYDNAFSSSASGICKMELGALYIMEESPPNSNSTCTFSNTPISFPRHNTTVSVSLEAPLGTTNMQDILVSPSSGGISPWEAFLQTSTLMVFRASMSQYLTVPSTLQGRIRTIDVYIYMYSSYSLSFYLAERIM